MPRKGQPASEAQKAAAARNFAKGHKANAERRAKAKAEGQSTRSERWAQLISGQITVQDLDDEEIVRHKVKNADGLFTSRHQALPSHLSREFQNEYNRRTIGRLREYGPRLIEILLEIAENGEKDSDRRAAVHDAMDRVFGKAPERIVVENTSDFDAMLNAVTGWEEDRDTVLTDDIE